MNLFYFNASALRFTLPNPFHTSTPHSHLSSSLLPHISAWNSLLKSQVGHQDSKSPFLLFRQILQANVKPNDLTFSLLIKACISLSISFDVNPEAKQIHTHILKCGFDRFDYLSTALLDFYAKTGRVSIAEQLFEGMPHRDLIAWNSLISGYSHNGYDFDGFRSFSEMLKLGMSPCPVTLVSVIPCCALDFFLQGKSIHGFATKTALDLDSRVENALTAMYARCSDINTARLLFESMSERSAVSWNTMISAYSQNGYPQEALSIFKRMCKENVEANAVTIVSLLSTGASSDSIYAYAVKIGVDSDASVNTSLICMYARSGSTKSAQMLYESMPCKNLISLTAIISSYAEKGDMASALECFASIQHENMKPDAVAIVSILHGCTSFPFSTIGIAFHGYAIKTGLASDTLVTNGLISMYDKLNDIDAATSLFFDMDDRQLISWNSMIKIFVQAGRFNDAMELFCQMKVSGCNPDTITMAGMLSWCSQTSSLLFGKSLHTFILRNNLEVEDFVETSLIDMYAKCGSIVYAKRVFTSIKEPCLASWNTMISGYATCGVEHEAILHYSEMIEWGIKPDDITFLGVLSACSHAGRVDDGRKFFWIMREFGLEPGLQHCARMIDLFTRAGLLAEAVIFVNNMKAEPDSVVWLTLLGACYTYKEVKLGECVAKKIFLLDQRNGGFYVLMSNLYASTGKWNDVARVRKMMRDIGEDGCPGISSIEATRP